MKEQVGGDGTRRTERASFRLREWNWMHLSSQEAGKEFGEFLSRGPCFLHKAEGKSFSENRGGREASEVWSRREDRLGLLGRGRAQQRARARNRPGPQTPWQRDS